MEEMSISDILYIVQCDQVREMWTTIGYAAIAVISILALAWFVCRPAVNAIIEKVKKAGVLNALFVIAIFVLPAINYGSNKKTAITNFNSYDSADWVTFTWREDAETAVSSVQIQRRLKGATEEEAWENWGSAVQGGRGYVTIPGFVIDKDWEYRAVYIYMQY